MMSTIYIACVSHYCVCAVSRDRFCTGNIRTTSARGSSGERRTAGRRLQRQWTKWSTLRCRRLPGPDQTFRDEFSISRQTGGSCHELLKSNIYSLDATISTCSKTSHPVKSQRNIAEGATELPSVPEPDRRPVTLPTQLSETG